MPVIRDIPLHLKKKDILRRQGFRGQKKVKAKIEDVIGELLDSVEESQLLKPAAAYETYPIVEMQPNCIILDGGGVVNGTLIPGTFAEAVEITAMVCTIGPGLEKQVTNYSTSIL